MRISSLQKEGLVKRLKNLSGIIGTIDFRTSLGPLDDLEPTWVPNDCKHKLCALDIGSRFCCHLIFGESPNSARARQKEKQDLSQVTRCLQRPFLVASQ
jgi:hypothetical protein